MLAIALVAPVTALAAPTADASAAGDIVTQQNACPPGLTGPTCSDGIPTESAKALAFEATPAATVVLGAKAVRSNGNPMLKTGSGPYTMSGTDSDGNAYTFETDCNYGDSPNPAAGPYPFNGTCSNNLSANLNESEERGGSISTSRTVETFTDVAGVTVNNAIKLSSSGGINPNTRDV